MERGESRNDSRSGFVGRRGRETLDAVQSAELRHHLSRRRGGVDVKRGDGSGKWGFSREHVNHSFLVGERERIARTDSAVAGDTGAPADASADSSSFGRGE